LAHSYILPPVDYITTSRPDIIFGVCLYTRYQSNPKEPHLKAVKIRYINKHS